MIFLSRLLAIFSISSILLPAFRFVESSSIPEFRVKQSNGRIVDQFGRERIFHGFNVVVKGPPWHPYLEGFDSKMSVSSIDFSILRSLGANAVRLGVMWPGAEPTRGQFNESYIEIMVNLVKNLASAGIYTLVEMHQDVFSSRLCGEGVPTWLFEQKNGVDNRDTLSHSVPGFSKRASTARKLLESQSSTTAPNTVTFGVDSTKNQNVTAPNKAKKPKSSWEVPCFLKNSCKSPMDYVISFPEPLSPRYAVDNPSNSTDALNDPSPELCLSHKWANYHFSFAVARAYQDLYKNNWGWGDAMARYWARLARAFKDVSGVLGYELINEPWIGDQYSDPTLLIPGIADRKNLLPFYDKLQAAIRAEDDSKLLFFESIVFDNVRCGFSRVPGDPSWANMSVLSFHYYYPPNLSIQQTFKERSREVKRLKCGSFVTEFALPEVPRDPSPGTKGPSRGSVASRLRSGAGAAMDFLAERFEGRGIRQQETSEKFLEAADQYVQSWLGWQYKRFVDKTGSSDGPFNGDGSLNLPAARALARTYPVAVAGTIASFQFDSGTASFSLVYTAGSLDSWRDDEAESAGTTVVWFSERFHYEGGFEWSVVPGSVEVSLGDSCLLIRHDDSLAGSAIAFSLKRKE